MAAVTKNVSPVLRFENLGTLVLSDATDDITFKNIEPGTLVITPGGYDKISTYDQSVPQPPIKGNSRMSRVAITLRVGNDDTSAGAYATLQSVDVSSTSLMYKEWTKVVITTLDTDATGTGLPYSAKNLSLVPGSLSKRAGREYDTIQFELESRDPYFQFTATPT